ncbi:uncharacterized protein LOC118154533 [Callithrix jacchus]
MALAPRSRAGDRASRDGRLGAPSPAAARAPAASCLPPAALPPLPPALSAPAPNEPPSPAPPLGVAAAAAASLAAENEAAFRSPGRALGHLIGGAGAPARPDGELRPANPAPDLAAAALALSGRSRRTQQMLCSARRASPLPASPAHPQSPRQEPVCERGGRK